jgi:chromosome segregation ATPase
MHSTNPRGAEELPPFDDDSPADVELASPARREADDSGGFPSLHSGVMLEALPPLSVDEEREALRAEREALAAERQELERAIRIRQGELDAQAAELDQRRRDLDEHERVLLESARPDDVAMPAPPDDDEDDALPEWLAPAPKKKLVGKVGDTYALEAEALRKQVHELEASVALLHAERDNAWTQLEEMRREQAELKRRLRQLDPEFRKADPPPRPPSPRTHHGLQHVDLESEWTEVDRLRIQLADAERRLDALRRQMDSTPPTLLGHAAPPTELHQQFEARREELDAQQQRLDQLERELVEGARTLRDRIDRLDVHERELRVREARVDLREAEMRELRELAELEIARERAELNQERVRIARLREQLRLEREDFLAERGAHDAAERRELSDQEAKEPT